MAQKIPFGIRQLTPQLSNPNAVARAGGIARTVNEAAGNMYNDMQVERERQEVANAETWLAQSRAKMEMEVMDTLEGKRQEFEQSPDGFAKNFREMLQQRDVEIASMAPNQRARDAWANSMLDYQNQIYSQNIDWENKQRVTNYAQRLSDATEVLNMQAYRSRNTASLPALAEKVEQLTEAGRTFMADDALAEYRKKTINSVASNAMVGMIEDSPHKAIKLLDNQELDQYLEPDQITKLRASAQASIDRQEAKREQERRKAIVRSNSLISNALSRVKKGYALPQAELDEITTAAAATGEPDVIAQAGALSANIEFGRRMQTLNESELQGLINTQLRPAVSKNGATDDEVMRLELAESYLNTMSTQLQNDPRSFAMRTGLIEPDSINFAPANQEQAAAAIAQMQDAVATDKLVAERFNIEPGQALMTEEDSRALTNAVAKMAPDQKLQYGKFLAEGYGDMAPVALQKISNSDPVFAYAVSHLATGGAPDVAEGILRGQAFMAENPELQKQVLPTTDAYAEFNGIVGNAFSLSPETQSALFTAANAYHIDRVRRSGGTNFEPTAYKKSVQVVAGMAKPGGGEKGGGIIEFNNSKLVAPRGVTENQFERGVYSLNEKAMKEYSVGGGLPMRTNAKGDMVPLTPSEVSDHARFINVAPNRYVLQFQDGNFAAGTGRNGLYEIELTRDRIQNLIVGGIKENLK